MSNLPPGLPDHEDFDDRRVMDRRSGPMSDRELLIRVDERLAGLIQRIDNREDALVKMRADIDRNTEAANSTKQTVDRHDKFINWGVTLILGAVLMAILWETGIAAGSL